MSPPFLATRAALPGGVAGVSDGEEVFRVQQLSEVALKLAAAQLAVAAEKKRAAEAKVKVKRGQIF